MSLVDWFASFAARLAAQDRALDAESRRLSHQPIYDDLVVETGTDPLEGVAIGTHPLLAEGVTAAVIDGDHPNFRELVGIRAGRLVFADKDVI